MVSYDDWPKQSYYNHLFNLYCAIFHVYGCGGYNKVTRKVRKRRHRNPLFGHIGDEISENRKKKGTMELQGGMKLSLAANLVLNWVCPVLFFSWTPSTNQCCRYVYCRYKCSRASCIYLILSISYPYLIKFHDFADNSQKGMKRQMRGETQAQQVRDKLFRGPNRGDRWNFFKELFFSFFQELFSTIPILAKGQIHGSIQQKSDGLRSSHKNLNPLCCTTVQVGNLLTLVHI